MLHCMGRLISKVLIIYRPIKYNTGLIFNIIFYLFKKYICIIFFTIRIVNGNL